MSTIHPKILSKYLFLFLPFFLLLAVGISAQKIDSASVNTDTLSSVGVTRQVVDSNPLNDLLKKNIFLNSTAAPEYKIQDRRAYYAQDSLFYLMVITFIFLGIIKSVYGKYFENLQRVFFNTSLRQSQLTDQLLQAKLPSLLMNIFFVLVGATYLTLLFNLHSGKSIFDWKTLLYSVLIILVVYLTKYIFLLFIGWVTGFKKEIESYIFIVFLVNKMAALLLAPLVVLIAFANHGIASFAMVLSYALLGLMLLLRYVRSVGMFQSSFKVNRLHFALYVFSVELLPILLIYKATMIILFKNL